MPIIPVEETKKLFLFKFVKSAALVIVFSTAFIPFVPVHALAFPLLTITPYMSLFFIVFFETISGAAKILFFVKTACDIHFADDIIKPKSFFLDFFKPQFIPENLKPKIFFMLSLSI